MVLAKKFMIGCGALLAIGLILITIGGVWLVSAPEGGVRTRNDMESYALEYLSEHEILEPTEELVAYYDVTIKCDGTEAAILTTERVIYHKNGREDALNLGDVEDVQHRKEGLTGDVFEIYGTAGELIKIEIAPMNQGETFGNALRRAVAAQQKSESQ